MTLAGQRDGTWYQAAGPQIRGGILADEMGMGKTMVCISLVLANPPPPKTPAAKLFGMPASTTPRTTLIVVNNTLVQQWYDECTRYAPKLEVRKLYASSKKWDPSSTDILITTPHTIKSSLLSATSPREWHRIIIDESHLMDQTGGAKAGASSWANVSNTLNQVKASKYWLVSGTPVTSGGGMHRQLGLLGQMDGGLRFTEDVEIKQADVDKLKRIMIRHCKSQRIGGEVALALPDCDCRTVLLDMSADEKILYDNAACEEGVDRERHKEEAEGQQDLQA